MLSIAPLEAIAFQNEGTTNINVLSGVAAQDNIWSPGDVVPVGTVDQDYYATGTNPAWFDAVSLEFNANGLDPTRLTLRAYLQKGSYYDLFWEHYQVLPGKFNPNNEDAGGDYCPSCFPSDAIRYSSSGNLPADTTVGWVDIPFNATSDPSYILPNGNVAVTLRLWNWRVDAIELDGDKPDLAATSLAWNPAQGRVDFSFQVNGAALPKDATAALYWASGTTENTILEPAATPVAIPSTTPVGRPQTIHVDQQDVQSAPPDAKYLLAELDPSNAIAESDETNNIAFVAYDPIKMDSATSPNSKTIRFSYDISEAEPAQPITVRIYRSNSPGFDPITAVEVDEQTVPQQDSIGGDSEAVGPHTVEIQSPDALLPDPDHEFVYVVADPGHSIGDPTGAYHEAHYRKFVLGVVSHGFLLDGQLKVVPDWEKQTAADLYYIDGYNTVIIFDWSQTSNIPLPGQATAAGDRLEQQIVSNADELVQQLGAEGDVVDLHLIGHSRGAVVISRALQDLVGTTDPALAGGYKLMTMLDPHPANVSLFAGDHSFGVYPLPSILNSYFAFETLAADPQVVIPPDVDQAELYYQHTPAPAFSTLRNPAEAILNLWGEAPGLITNESSVPLTRLNLTGYVDPDPKIGLVGHSEVPLFYDKYVVEQGTVFAGYSSLSGSDGTSAILTAAVPQALPSASSRATGPQGAYSSPSSVRLISPSPVQVSRSPLVDLSERRSMTDSLAQSASATNQAAVAALVMVSNDATAGQSAVLPPPAPGTEARTPIGAPAGARRLRSLRVRAAISHSSAGQGITRPFVRKIGYSKATSPTMIRDPSTFGGDLENSRAKDRLLDLSNRRA